MNKILNFIKVIFVILIFASTSNAGIKYYQSTKLNTDGSATLSITYSANTSEISKNNNTIGIFTFDQKGLKDYFNFTGANILKSVVHKDPEDANKTAVTVEINAKNLFKIMDAKAFKDIKIAYLKSDTGMIFSWFVPESYVKSNSVDTYHFIVTSDFEVKSTNGLVKDGKINWFVFGNKPDARGYYFVTTVKSDGKFVSTESVNSKNNTGSTEDKKGGCGLFGIELPIILLAGYVFSNRIRKIK